MHVSHTRTSWHYSFHVSMFRLVSYRWTLFEKLQVLLGLYESWMTTNRSCCLHQHALNVNTNTSARAPFGRLHTSSSDSRRSVPKIGWWVRRARILSNQTLRRSPGTQNHSNTWTISFYFSPTDRQRHTKNPPDPPHQPKLASLTVSSPVHCTLVLDQPAYSF